MLDLFLQLEQLALAVEQGQQVLGARAHVLQIEQPLLILGRHGQIAGDVVHQMPQILVLGHRHQHVGCHFRDQLGITEEHLAALAYQRLLLQPGDRLHLPPLLRHGQIERLDLEQLGDGGAVFPFHDDAEIIVRQL